MNIKLIYKHLLIHNSLSHDVGRHKVCPSYVSTLQHFDDGQKCKHPYSRHQCVWGGGNWTHKYVLTQGANTLSVNKRHTRQ